LGKTAGSQKLLSRPYAKFTFEKPGNKIASIFIGGTNNKFIYFVKITNNKHQISNNTKITNN